MRISIIDESNELVSFLRDGKVEKVKKPIEVPKEISKVKALGTNVIFQTGQKLVLFKF